MKRKTITLVIYMLVCISLVSVGFAAWVITGGTSTNAKGGISASTVVDKSLAISAESWESNVDQIVFGKPSGKTNADAKWLGFDNNIVPDEVMDVTYAFTLSVADGQSYIKDYFDPGKSSYTFNVGTYDGNNNFTISSDKTNVITSAVESNYITGPTLTYYIYDSTNSKWDEYDSEEKFESALSSKSSTSVNIKIKISFGWGTFTNKQNPFNYFNGIEEPTQTHKNNAKSIISKLYELNDVDFQLSIKFGGKNLSNTTN